MWDSFLSVGFKAAKWWVTILESSIWMSSRGICGAEVFRIGCHWGCWIRVGTLELHHDDEAIGKISVLLTRFLLFSITRTQPNLDQGLNCRDATRSELRRLSCFAGFHPCRVCSFNDGSLKKEFLSDSCKDWDDKTLRWNCKDLFGYNSRVTGQLIGSGREGIRARLARAKEVIEPVYRLVYITDFYWLIPFDLLCSQQNTAPASNGTHQASSQQARHPDQAAAQRNCSATYIWPGAQCLHSGVFILSLPNPHKEHTHPTCTLYCYLGFEYLFSFMSELKKHRIIWTQSLTYHVWIDGIHGGPGGACLQGGKYFGSIWYTWAFLWTHHCSSSYNWISKVRGNSPHYYTWK